MGSIIAELGMARNTTDIAEIKLIDKQLPYYICKAQEKTLLELNVLENGLIPINFIMSSRQISYLQEVLNRSNNELLKRVYLALQEKPIPRTLCKIS